jgi:hypothetical protein
VRSRPRRSRRERPPRGNGERGAREAVAGCEARRHRERRQPGVAAFGRDTHDESLAVARGPRADDTECRRNVVAAGRLQRLGVDETQPQHAGQLLPGVEPRPRRRYHFNLRAVAQSVVAFQPLHRGRDQQHARFDERDGRVAHHAL